MADETEGKPIDFADAHLAVERLLERLGSLTEAARLLGLKPESSSRWCNEGLVGMYTDASTVMKFLTSGDPACDKCRRLQRQISWLKRTYDAGDQSDMLRCFAESCEFQHEVSNKQGHCHNVYELLTNSTLPDELKDAAQTLDLLARERDSVNDALRAIFDNCLEIRTFPKKIEGEPDDLYEVALIGDDLDDGAGGCQGVGSGDEPEEAIINAVAHARKLGNMPEEEKKDGDPEV